MSNKPDHRERRRSDHQQESRARIESGQAWEDFCDTLKAAGREILNSPENLDHFDRAEGYRYLSRLTRGALETFIEYADPQAPELRRTCHETIKMGADNPDNYYQYAPISGKYDYLLTGNVGTVHDLGFGIQEGNYGQTGNLPTTAYLDVSDLETDDEGNFEIHVSQRPHEGNWLPMTPNSRTLNIRQTINDRENETLARISIRRVDGPHQARPITPWKVDRGLLGAAKFVEGCARLFQQWSMDLMKTPNALPLFDPDAATAAGGVPHIRYYHGYWELAPDEALVIEVTPPDCHFWNFQLNNYWMESLDYRYFPVTINMHSASYEEDGSVRIIIASEDPGHGNWMDRCAHDRGTMCLRWVHATEHPTPTTRVVKLEELRRGER